LGNNRVFIGQGGPKQRQFRGLGGVTHPQLRNGSHRQGKGLGVSGLGLLDLDGSLGMLRAGDGNRSGV